MCESVHVSLPNPYATVCGGIKSVMAERVAVTHSLYVSLHTYAHMSGRGGQITSPEARFA